MEPKFHKADGRLTAYALSCGYLESAQLADGRTVRLSAEHGQYHVTVRQNGHAIHQRMVAERIEDARREFNRLTTEGQAMKKPIFQRRHYESVARAVGDTMARLASAQKWEGREIRDGLDASLLASAILGTIREDLAKLFAADNPGFDTKRFREAVSRVHHERAAEYRHGRVKIKTAA